MIFIGLLSAFAGQFPIIIFLAVICLCFYLAEKSLYKKIGFLIWTEDYVYIETKNGEHCFFNIDQLSRIYKKGKYFVFVKNYEEYKANIIGKGIMDFLSFMNERKPKAVQDIVQDERVMRDIAYFENVL